MTAALTEMQQIGNVTVENRLAGLLLGTAVGDSVGLPAEGLSPRWRQRLFPGRGVIGCYADAG